MKEFTIMDDRIGLHAKLDVPKGRMKYPLVIIPYDNHCFDFHLDEMCAAITDFLSGEM